LEILTSLSHKENIESILRELQIYVKEGNEKFVCTAVRAISCVAADADPDLASSCMEGVMHLLLCTKSTAVSSQCVVVLRQILQLRINSATSNKIVRQLAKLLIIEDGIEESSARSSIVWLVGEFHEVLSEVSPDILRILAAGFTSESTETKTQIMNFAIKLSLLLPEDDTVQVLMTYVLELSRYDSDTDLRDRSRVMTAMMGLAPSSGNEEADSGAAGASGSGAQSSSAVDENALYELTEHAPGKFFSDLFSISTLQLRFM
jgi:AP-3 complex subunit beta